MTLHKIKILLILNISSLLFVFSCSDENSIFDNIQNVDNTDFSASELFTHNVGINNQNTFSLNGINGTVKVIPTNGPLVIVSGVRIVESQTLEDAQEYLKNLQVSVKDLGDEVVVETQQPQQNYGRNLIVNYEIQLPKAWTVNLTNVNGDIIVDSLQGDLLINLVNGPVKLNNIYSNVTVDVVNGNIDGHVTLPSQGNCTMGIVNGPITLAIPQNTSAQFSAKLTNGSINLNNLELQNMQSSNTSMTGTLSTGQGSIDLQTVNGTISVNGF
ncbi:MAG: hypothetical protein D8M58_05520 [Calditrichaeota bacterium]|nr:MAG: hypothetical protein DWQ03_20985 [Calditrichota bacterium]MBL1204835.1 hypothetical protein [Calditrichota bacterium]NOG44664.1 DUF4097 family beta strand repeat protein [Calditrichota bacterium]